MTTDPIDTIKTFDLDLDEEEAISSDFDFFDGLEILDKIKYESGHTDRHGIPIDKEYWEEI